MCRGLGKWDCGTPDLTGAVKLDWKLALKCLRFGLCYCIRKFSAHGTCMFSGSHSLVHRHGWAVTTQIRFYGLFRLLLALSNCTTSTWWLSLNTPVCKFLFTEDVFLDLLFWMCANRFKIACFYQMCFQSVSELSYTKMSLIPPIRLFLLASYFCW